MSIKPHEFSSLNDMIYRSLKLAILRGEYEPEQRIVELDIARKMKTSQGPVREALMRLERDGLVVRYQHRRTFVSPLPRADTIPELYKLRRSLEEMAVKRLIDRVTDDHVDRLQAVVNEMSEHARARDVACFFDADMAFHDLIFQFSDHEMLQRVWSVVVVQVRRLLPLTRNAFARHLAQTTANHQPLVDAIRARDFAQWKTVWRNEHMQHVWSDLGVDVVDQEQE